MAIEVRVCDSQYGWGLGIFLVQEAGGSRHILRPVRAENGTMNWDYEEVKEGIAIEPSLILDEPWCRALADALVNRFNGTEDTRKLRADYDHEKKRVDKLMDYLMKITLWLRAESASVRQRINPLPLSHLKFCSSESTTQNIAPLMLSALTWKK